jgi:hypothetical protein
MHPLNHKGWLRQYLPNPSPGQLHHFIDSVGLMLHSYPSPSARQIETARLYAYRQMTGALAP